MSEVKSSIGLTIRRAAEVLQSLSSLESELRFPTEFVEGHDGKLQAIAMYSNRALIPWEPEWGMDLRTVGIREVAKIVIKGLEGGGAACTAEGIAEEDRELIKQKLLAYEAVSGVEFGCSMRTLWVGSGLGREADLLRLVQLDKSAVTLPFVRGWIKRRQHLGDWGFFERLGKAMTQPPLTSPAYMLGAVLLTAGFWDEHFSRVSYRETVRTLEDLRLLPKGTMDPKSFAQTMKRHGLTKTKHSRYVAKCTGSTATSESSVLSQS